MNNMMPGGQPPMSHPGMMPQGQMPQGQMPQGQMPQGQMPMTMMPNQQQQIPMPTQQPPMPMNQPPMPQNNPQAQQPGGQQILIDNFRQRINEIFQKPEFVQGDEDLKKELIGETIYPFVEHICGE
jgi:hypothetical protein